MAVFNIFYKAKLGPNSMESVIAELEEEAINKFKVLYPNAEIVTITKPLPGNRR